jgi:hypothetical protein
MKPDSMIVEPEHIHTAGKQLAEKGTESSMQELAGAEPALASFIGHMLSSLAGDLALSGAPTPVVHQVHEKAMDVVLIARKAFRLGQYQLWKDTLPGTPLGRLEETPAEEKPGPKRKKKRGGKGDQA